MPIKQPVKSRIKPTTTSRAAACEPSPAGAPTLKDVALRAGVSINTVSRSLRAPHTVRPALRAAIRSVLDELDYVPNRLAGGLASSQTGIVGVIVTSLHYSEFAGIIEAMQERLSQAGVQLIIGNSRYDSDEELALLRSMLSWRPAAIVVVGTDHHPQARRLLQGATRPVIEIWDCSDEIVDSGVGMDHRAIGALQVAHLREQGCRRLAFVGALRPNDMRAAKRLEGARVAVAKGRLRALAVASEAAMGHPDMGERLITRLLATDPSIDGVICNGDIMAHGVLRGLRRLRRRIPNDIAVIGFGENPSNDCVEPPLSSIDPPRADIGRSAAELVLARIDGKASQRILLAPTLIARRSSRLEKHR